MSREADTTAEQALLMELAHLGMGMARKVHEAALATTASETDKLLALVTAYQHMSRGVRQSLALRARFAAGTAAPALRAEANLSARSGDDDKRGESDDPGERPDWNERPDWRIRLERGETLHADDDVNRARIARDLTVVSRTPALAAIPALQAPAATLGCRAALLTGASLRLVNTS